MQHIEIHEPTHCTIVNVDSVAPSVAAPPASTSRVCAQCELPTWRYTPTCIHCGFDRWARYRLAAGAVAGATALVVVIFHPLRIG